MNNNQFTEGINLLRQPVLPLVSMVQFLFMTGPFEKVAEVIDELPELIETARTVYERPKALLSGYLDILAGFEGLKAGTCQAPAVVDEADRPVDEFTAGAAMIRQRILKAELERINSVLCAPCGCTLCCVGPDQAMAQEFFEIPLKSEELGLFALKQCDTEESRKALPLDEEDLVWEGLPFYAVKAPTLFHWKKGWSMILPRGSNCPNLGDKGQCRMYNDRPDVCRRPQIFPYVVEQLEAAEGEAPVMRIRESLLAVIDCPYVRELQEEITEYAAACELYLHVTHNKG